jgi:hypothetical protein
MCWDIRCIASTRFDGITIWSESFTDATPAWLERTDTSAAECGGTDAIREAIVCMGDVRAVTDTDTASPEHQLEDPLGVYRQALCRAR